MKTFWIDPAAQTEFNEATSWYESQREGLGLEFVAEVKRALLHVAQTASFATAPIDRVGNDIVRRETVKRFPYVVVFAERGDHRRVIMIRHKSSSPARWRTRL